MSFSIVFLICFCVLIVSAFAFLTFVYIKEYNREEKTIKDFMKQMKAEQEAIAPFVYIAAPPAKKKKAEIPPLPKIDKKGMN